MRLNVYNWDATPGVSPRLYQLSAKRGEVFVEEGRGEMITGCDGRIAIRKLAPVDVIEKRMRHTAKASHGQIINKLQRPPAFNEPIPAVCDYRLAWRHSFMHMAHAEQGQYSPIRA